MKLLLDLNILLDVVLEREPFVTDAVAVCRECAAGRATGYVAGISFPTLFYIVNKIQGSDAARECVSLCLASFEVCAVGRDELELAASLVRPDFEDNVQIAVAVKSGMDFIITRDPVGFSQSPVKAMSPSEWLSRPVSTS